MLGLDIPVEYPRVNVHGPSPLRGWMLLFLVSPSIVGDRGKGVGKGALRTLGVCFPGVSVIEIRPLQ